MDSVTIKTNRLILRKHCLSDFDRFWAMLNDPVANCAPLAYFFKMSGMAVMSRQ
jgi:hypothetical protein